MNPLALIFDALTFRSEAFQQLKASPSVLARGIMVLFLVALIVGLVSEGARQMELSSVRSAAEVNAVVSQLEGAMGGAVAANPFIRPFVQASVREGVLMAIEIDALPPRGGAALKPLARALDFLGRWLGTPFQAGWLVTLLLLGSIVHVGALWLGGRGTIAQLLGLTALAFSPALLTIIPIVLNAADRLTTLPGLAGVAAAIGFLVTLWQLGIYIKAVSVAEELSLGRTIGAMALAVGASLVIVLVLAFAVSLLLGLWVRPLFLTR